MQSDLLQHHYIISIVVFMLSCLSAFYQYDNVEDMVKLSIVGLF